MNQNNGNVSFKLRHTLTKVNIYVKVMIIRMESL